MIPGFQCIAYRLSALAVLYRNFRHIYNITILYLWSSAHLHAFDSHVYLMLIIRVSHEHMA